jgi:hypothetical protein
MIWAKSNAMKGNYLGRKRGNYLGQKLMKGNSLGSGSTSGTLVPYDIVVLTMIL